MSGILSDPVTLHTKLAMPDLQWYPEKLCLIKYKIYISVICFCIFHLWVLCESDMRISCKKQAMEKLAEVITFRVRETTVSSTVLIRLKFQWYRCKSDIALFAWRFTWNYAYWHYITDIVKMNFPARVCLVTVKRFLR